MTKFKPIDCDIIYLSYDEPNAEQNYADLCKKVPWAKRVHGVEGSDAAHKACARLSETDRFITCLLYTSPSPRDAHESRMPSSA